MPELLKWMAFAVLLRPLIRRNYRLRAAGKLPDEMYWADRLAMRWGCFVEA